MRKYFFAGLSIVLFVPFIIFSYALWGAQGILQPISSRAPLTIYIHKGQGATAIGTQLVKEKIFVHISSFYLALFIGGGKGQLKAGEYEIPPGIAPIEVLNYFIQGKVVIHKLTIPEGITVNMIAQLIQNCPHLEGEIKEIPSEGSLMPDTYSYVWQDQRQDILKRMHQAMEQFLNQEWEKYKSSTALTSPQQVLILASIVEKETGRHDERERVAAVFLNRLAINMKLQSDPTVIYALTEGKMLLERPLTRQDLKIESPFNTYFASGLPPTAIACPGRAAIIAVLRPAKTDELYFVANGNGGHSFSHNLQQHNNHVNMWRAYQKSFKNNS